MYEYSSQTPKFDGETSPELEAPWSAVFMQDKEWYEVIALQKNKTCNREHAVIPAVIGAPRRPSPPHSLFITTDWYCYSCSAAICYYIGES